MGEDQQYNPVAGVFDLVSQGANMIYDNYQTKKGREWASAEAEKNRDFQMEMYNRQLSDSIDWREHQEQYNSPSAQMQRFADAGINPMYFVTGANGGTTVHTPSLTGGFGSTPVTPQTPTGRLSVSEAVRLQNETRIARGQERLLDAEARKANAEAQNQEYSHSKSKYFSDVWSIYHKRIDGLGGNMADEQARFMEACMHFEWKMMDLNYEDAKLNFEHSKEVRSFAKDLQQHQRSMFEYELSQAKSAADIYAVSAKWAVRNQWINAGSQILGAATGLARAFNVPQTVVTKTITTYGDYKKIINNENW